MVDQGNDMRNAIITRISDIPKELAEYVRKLGSDKWTYIGFDELSNDRPLTFMIILGQYLVHMRDTCGFEKGWQFRKFIKETFTIDIKYCDHAINLVNGTLKKVTIPNESLNEPYSKLLSTIKEHVDKKKASDIRETLIPIYRKSSISTKLRLLILEHILTLPGLLSVPRVISEVKNEMPEEEIKYNHINSTFRYLERLKAIESTGERVKKDGAGNRALIWSRTKIFDAVISTTIEELKKLENDPTIRKDSISSYSGKRTKKDRKDYQRISDENKVSIFKVIQENISSNTFTREDLKGLSAKFPVKLSTVMTALAPLTRLGYFTRQSLERRTIYTKTALFYSVIGMDCKDAENLSKSLDEALDTFEEDSIDANYVDEDTKLSYEDIGIALEKRLFYLSNRCEQLEADSQACRVHEKHIISLQERNAELVQELESKKTSDFSDLKSILKNKTDRIAELEGENKGICRDNDSLKAKIKQLEKEKQEAEDLAAKLAAEIKERNSRSKKKKKRTSSISLNSFSDLKGVTIPKK